MNSNGEIIVVDDDVDDLEILKEAYSVLPFKNRLVVFTDSEDAYYYLKNPDSYPFLIISDINMPRMNGFELRDRVFADAENNDRVIPFIFMSTCVDRNMMKSHCKSSFQGYFEKRSDFNEMIKLLEKIISYWKEGLPNN
ncbi:response regulator [Flavobacterium rakeshii]|uniref:response regulator n=1 Tax=Flavobacterium rakeshii TaxID=1038845 RepID=UPI002E7BAF8B|nr:response regulator [Flavobacterium rakeshii]MEE1896990.1 response regulator [Flavobacterium rakeshii]